MSENKIEETSDTEKESVGEPSPSFTSSPKPSIIDRLPRSWLTGADLQKHHTIGPHAPVDWVNNIYCSSTFL